ncbi:MAG: hypothetical protein K1X88_20685 [Nannocystaceae bacterium]|nr:hypothetical protein [Nannocystaceae bacterium]
MLARSLALLAQLTALAPAPAEPPATPQAQARADAAPSRPARRRGKRPARAGRVQDTVKPPAPSLGDVERQFTVAVALPPTMSYELRPLPGAVGLELVAAAAPAVMREAAFSCDPAFACEVGHEGEAQRLRIVHPSGRVAFDGAREADQLVLRFGVLDEDARLHAISGAMQQPLPEPATLGAELELWQEAERVTRQGDLAQARIRWERLAEVPTLADLAELRLAELFIVSGHVNEALARLRAVARQHPRSLGAALARLDVLQLEAITKQGKPTVEQVDVALGAMIDSGFEPFARLRAAMVLLDMGEPTAAFLRMPEVGALPPAWTEAGEALRQHLAESTFAAPALRGDPRTTAIHWAAWHERAGTLTAHDAVLDVVAAAHERLGMFEPAIELLKQRLRSAPGSLREGDIVARLAHDYRMLGDGGRAAEAAQFAATNHPAVPSLPATIAALAIVRCEREGLSGGRTELQRFRDATRDAVLSRALDAIELELALAWGTPVQIVHLLTRDPQGHAMATVAHADPVTLTRHRHALAVALVRSGRYAEAAPMLRELSARSTDPLERDRLGYHLGVAELALGHAGDAAKIFAVVSEHGTSWSALAKARRHERRLELAAAALSIADTEATR